MANTEPSTAPPHDEGCYLCPRVTRANGTVNADYIGTLAFDNDFPSLSFASPECHLAADPLLQIAPSHGVCRVLCWSERHDATLGSLNADEMRAVAALWQQEYVSLSADERIAQVNIFFVPTMPVKRCFNTCWQPHG